MKWLGNRKVICAVCLLIVIYTMKGSFTFYFPARFWTYEDGKYRMKTIFPPKKVCLCIRLRARMGNRLYMIASAYSLAKSKGMELCISGNVTDIPSGFNIPGTFVSRSKRCENLNNTVKEPGCNKFSQNILQLPADKPVLVKGYLQNYRYFDKYRHDIKKIFSFREHILHTARNTLEKLLKERFGDRQKSELLNHTLVGVHIRRSDYLKRSVQARGFKVAPKEYLFKAQHYMRTHYPKVIFIVCSLDIKWNKEIFSNQSDVIVAPRGSAAEDMALLTLTNHTIITAGTYGFWSAWLNQHNGTVIYYKDFAKPNTSYSRNFDLPYTDIYYPYWIGM